MEKPIRYGVVGIGGMGANHAKKLQENKIENAILTAVADSNVEYKNKFDGGYIGLSFIVKNILILLIAGGYFYFYFFLNKADKLIKEDKEISKKVTNENKEEMVDSLEEFLEDDEIK